MRVKVTQKQEATTKAGSKPVVVVFPDGKRTTIRASTPTELAKKIGDSMKKSGIRSFRFRVNGKDVDIARAEEWLPDLLRDGGKVEVVPIAEAG